MLGENPTAALALLILAGLAAIVLYGLIVPPDADWWRDDGDDGGE